MSRRATLEIRPSQTSRIVDLLRSRSPEWVPLPEILDMRPRISQFSARVWEARHRWGLSIENRVENVGGEKRSWFRLIEPTQDVTRPGVLRAYPPAALTPGSLFDELAPERYPE